MHSNRQGRGERIHGFRAPQALRRQGPEVRDGATIRYNSRLHHNRPRTRERVIALSADRYIRMVDTDTGELLRELTLDPSRVYQALGRPPCPCPRPKKR
jgi:hypothetical protein